MQSLEIAKEIGEFWIQGLVLENLGEMYEEKGDFTKARKVLLESLEINRKIGNKKGIADGFISIGYLMGKEKKYDDALKLFNDALKIRKELGDKRGIGLTLSAIGIVLSEKEDYKEACKYIEEGLMFIHEVGIKLDEMVNLLELAHIYGNLMNLDKMRNNLKKASDLVIQIADRVTKGRFFVLGIKFLMLQKEFFKAMKILVFIRDEFKNVIEFYDDLKKIEKELLNSLRAKDIVKINRGKRLTVKQVIDLILGMSEDLE